MLSTLETADHLVLSVCTVYDDDDDDGATKKVVSTSSVGEKRLNERGPKRTDITVEADRKATGTEITSHYHQTK